MKTKKPQYRTSSDRGPERSNAALRQIERVYDENDLTFEQFEAWLYEGVMDQERPVDAERHRVMAECDSFYLGGEYQFLVKSSIDGFPMLEDRDPDDKYFFADDQLGPLIDNNCTQFVRSRGLLKFIAPQDVDDVEGIARVASAIWGHYQEKLLRQDFLQREARRLMTHGGAWRCVFYDPNAGGKRAVAKQEEYEGQVSEDAWYCPKCGHQGTADEIEKPGEGQVETCPDCGYDDLVKAQVPKTTLSREGKPTAEPMGDLAIDQPDGYEMTTNSWASSWDETIFLRRKRRLDIGILRAMYPEAEFELFEDTTNDTHGLMYQRRFEAMFDPYTEIDARLARSSTRFERERDYTEVWYMPSYYEGVKLPEDFVRYEGTKDEIKLEAGVELQEYFPEGMRVCKSGKTILGVFNEDFHDKYVYYRYKVMPGRFYGKGVEGAIPLQRWLNELVSLVMCYLMTSGSPVFLFNETAFPDGMPPAGSPSQRIPTGNIPLDVSMDQVVKIIPPGTLAPGMFEMFAKVKEEMQAHLGAFSFFAGALPEAAQATATGLSLVHDQASGLMMMPLALRAEADARFGEMVIRLFRIHCKSDRYFQVAGAYSEQELEGLFASGEDLPDGIVATVEQNSYYPRLAYQLRNDAVEFFTWRGEYVQSHGKMPTPAEEQMMAERFGLPEMVNTAMLAGRRERQNFETAKEYLIRFQTGQLTGDEQLQLVMRMQQATVAALQQAQAGAQQAMMTGMPPAPFQPPDPTTIVLQAASDLVPIWPEQEDHPSMIAWLQRYAMKDAGGHEPPLVRQWIENRILARKTAVAGSMANEQGIVQDQMAPVMQKQFAMQAEQAAAMQSMGGAAGQPPNENPTVPEGPMPSTQKDQKRERSAQRANQPSMGNTAPSSPPVG